MGFSVNLGALKSVPQFVRDHSYEVKALAAGTAATALALRYFGKTEAVGAAGLAYLAYYYSDKISLISESVQNPKFLALVGATASLPFIASVPVIGIKLAIPIAASLALALLSYEMKQRYTINGLTENNQELQKRVEAYEEVTTSAQKLNEKQNRNNGALTDLLTKLVQNTGRLEQISEKDPSLKMTAAIKLLGELFTQVKEGDLANTIPRASELMREKRECEASLTRSEEEIKDSSAHLDEAKLMLEEIRRMVQTTE